MASLEAELDLEISKLRSKLKSANRQIAKFKGDTGKTGSKLGSSLFGGLKSGAVMAAKAMKTLAVTGIAVAAAATVSLVSGLKKAFDLGGRMSDVAARIGASAGQALVMGEALRQAGVPAEKLAPTIQKMQKSIVEAGEGLQTYKRAFDGIGLNVDDLLEMDSTGQFEAIAAAIAGIQDPTERSARAMQIFGRSGGEMLTLFSDPKAFGKARDMIGGQAAILDEKAADFDRASDIMGGMWSKLQGFFVGVGADMVEQILPALEFLGQLDLSGIGKRFGASLARGIALFRAALAELSTGNWLDALQAGLALAFKAAVNVLWRTLMASFTAAGTLFVSNIKTAIGLLGILTKAEFWKGLGNALLAAGNGLAAILSDAIASVLSGVAKIPGLAKFVGDQPELLREVAGDLRASASESGGQAKDQLLGPARDAMRLIGEHAKAVGDSFAAGYRNANDVFDTSAERATLADTVDRVRDRASQDTAGASGKKPAVPSPAPAPSASGGAGGLAPVVGSLAGAIGVLTGKSGFALSLDESKKQSRTLRSIDSSLKDIKNKKPRQPEQRPTRPLQQRFA